MLDLCGNVQGWAKEWSLGCVNLASLLPLVAGHEFTQPRDHSFAQPCNFPEFVLGTFGTIILLNKEGAPLQTSVYPPGRHSPA